MSKTAIRLIWGIALIAAACINVEHASADDARNEIPPKLLDKAAAASDKNPAEAAKDELFSTDWLRAIPRHQYAPDSLGAKGVLRGWYTCKKYPCLITQKGIIRISLKNRELENCRIEIKGRYFRKDIFAADWYRPIREGTDAKMVKTDKIKWVMTCFNCGEISPREVITAACSSCRERPGSVVHVVNCESPCHIKCYGGVQWLPILVVDTPDAGAKLQSSQFRIYTNQQNTGWPKGDEVITLTAPQRFGASATCFLRKPHPLPLTISFDYSNDGPNASVSEGFCLMIGANEAIYKKTPPPAFGAMGYNRDAGGLGLYFHKVYGHRVYRRVNLVHKGKWLENEDIPTPEKAGWKAVRVEITTDSVGVFLDGKLTLWWKGEVPNGTPSIAIGSASGARTNGQQIRNVKVEPLKTPTKPDADFLKVRADRETLSF